MPARKVGTVPFDLQAYFNRSDTIRDTDTAIEQEFEVFMESLVNACKDQMEKTGSKRLPLGSLVGEVCYQRWKQLGKQTKESWPWTEFGKKLQRNCGLTEKQYGIIKGDSINTSDRLIAFLQSQNQLPQPKIKGLMPPPPMKPVVPSASTAKATAGSKVKVSAAAQNFRPINSYATSPVEAGPKSSPVQPAVEVPSIEQSGTQAQVHTPTSSKRRSVLDWNDKAAMSAKMSGSEAQDDKVEPEQRSTIERSFVTGSSTSPPPHDDTDSSDEEPYNGPTSITDYDYGALPDPNWPGCYIEAPKNPGCGPWELTLPESFDPEVFIKPDLERISTLLGGVRLDIKLQPPSIRVLPSLAQRADMLADKSEDHLFGKTVLAKRWKAFRLLIQWAKHMRLHAKPPATAPMSMVDFIEQQTQEDIIKEGDEAREFVATHITKRLRRGLVLFPGRNYQVPKRPSVFEYEPSVKRQRSATYIPDSTEVVPEKGHPVTSSTEEKPQEQEEAIYIPRSPQHTPDSSIRSANSDPLASTKGQLHDQMDIQYLMNAKNIVEDTIQQSIHAKDYIPENNGSVAGIREGDTAAEQLQLHFKRENTLD
ncbi:hypothetical protein B0T11DRAFT_348836 [Plectosphaerella cucumerina]|uniref:Uncharacterized protein n=1 Tax=Plectosphaerella cucumerina TaxID=40658 RepID=A0A8K0X736_9PEZI|nr:hypothetical protein B0T11DRAFT_348836 [Plectosphaerella cucumerina]